MRLPSRLEPELTIVDRKIQQSMITLDIIIPVFNRGDLAAELIAALQNQVKALSGQVAVNLTCADDCSDVITSSKLKKLCAEFGFIYVKRETNLGFVGNVNTAWKMGAGDFVLILNSDVTITDGFLKTLLDPMTHDPKVGLSTNPTFGMLAARMDSGLNLNSLNAYLFESSTDRVSFVDACTAVGYSLVVRRSAINGPFLLDPKYGRGYGEDSDLHYRVVSDGYRSVWNLDHAVSHAGGASFDLVDSVDSDRNLGRKRFLNKWGFRYFAEINSHNLALGESIDRRVSGFSIDDAVNTWVVMPTVKGNIGGILVGCELATKKSQNDSQTRIVTLDNCVGTVISDFISVGRISDLFEKKASGEVVLVGAQALELLRDEKWINPALKFSYFAQGPDWLIDPNTFDLYKEITPRISEVYSVSEYMDSEILNFSNNIKILRSAPDINYAKYAGLSNQVKDTDFFFIYRLEFGKQGWLTTLLANFLSTTHSVTVSSEHRPFGLSNKVNLVSGLDRKGMLKQLAKARVYVDTSIFEGFGLTPREAALQNTSVLYLDVVDGREELKKYSSHFSTFDFSPSVFEMVEMARAALAKPTCPGCNFCLG
jgi:GT2 family glycosyltransferase